MNPFVQNIKLNVIKVNESYTLTPNVRNGAAPKESIVVPNYYLVEEISKTSVYHTSDLHQIVFKVLKAAGRDLLLYIILQIKKDCDFIKLQPVETMEYMGISRTTLYAGIQQLIDAGVICKKDVKTYWINPLYIFNGNRIKYFKDKGEEYINVVVTV